MKCAGDWSRVGGVVLHFPSISQLTSFWALLLSAVYLAGCYVSVWSLCFLQEITDWCSNSLDCMAVRIQSRFSQAVGIKNVDSQMWCVGWCAFRIDKREAKTNPADNNWFGCFINLYLSLVLFLFTFFETCKHWWGMFYLRRFCSVSFKLKKNILRSIKKINESLIWTFSALQSLVLAAEMKHYDGCCLQQHFTEAQAHISH